MIAHPPECVEDMVGCFLPPACRQEVLGDLCECYENVFQYALSAASVIPRVVLSQIRRNTSTRIFLVTTCGIYYSVAAGAVNFSQGDTAQTLFRIAIPIIPAILILLVRNGFAALEDRRQRAITFDIVIALGVAALTQLVLLAAFRSDLTLRGWWPSDGTLLAWLFVIVLRAFFPPEAKVPPAHRSLP